MPNRTSGLSKRARRAARTTARGGAAEQMRSAAARLSRAGRPRADGERYANGRLKPPKPNPVVLAQRAALLGAGAGRGAAALRAAENPLDLMRARGWLSAEQHAAGVTWGALYRAAGVALPVLRTLRLDEMDLAAHGAAAAAGRATRSATRSPMGDGDPAAMTRLTAAWSSLTRRELSALMEVCVLQTWPAWLLTLARGEAASPDAAASAERDRFARTLDALGEVLKTPMAKLKAMRAA
jgi:hypothetical protein